MAETIPYRREMSFEYGVLETVTPLVRRIVARNPSPFTFHGTGTFVLGRGNVAIVDPGPDLAEHVDAILAALEGETITHQLITHTHLDHSPASRLIKERTGAPILGFGPHGQGRYERGGTVEAGADLSFAPDRALAHGEVVEADGFHVEAVHTPGHCSNHLCFQLREERALFTGDHVMGWSTSVISPPDGDMGQYMASLQLLLERDDRIFWPTHGPPIPDTRDFVQAFLAHRRGREAQIVECMRGGKTRIADMVPVMYRDVPTYLHRAAARSVFAHVVHMLDRGLLTCEGSPGLEAEYRLV